MPGAGLGICLMTTCIKADKVVASHRDAAHRARLHLIGRNGVAPLLATHEPESSSHDRSRYSRGNTSDTIRRKQPQT